LISGKHTLGLQGLILNLKEKQKITFHHSPSPEPSGGALSVPNSSPPATHPGNTVQGFHQFKPKIKPNQFI